VADLSGYVEAFKNNMAFGLYELAQQSINDAVILARKNGELDDSEYAQLGDALTFALEADIFVSIPEDPDGSEIVDSTKNKLFNWQESNRRLMDRAIGTYVFSGSVVPVNTFEGPQNRLREAENKYILK